MNTQLVIGAENPFRITNQKDEPLCIYHSICSAVEYKMIISGVPCPEGGFSPNWLYRKAKSVYGGDGKYTYIQVLSVVKEYGLCPQVAYDNAEYDLDKIAKQYAIEAYTTYIFPTIEYIDELLLKNDVILVVAPIDQEDWSDGIITKEDVIFENFHGFCIIEKSKFTYNDPAKDFEKTSGYYLCSNNWGTKWGFDGFFYMHEDAVESLIVETYSFDINLDNQNVVF